MSGECNKHGCDIVYPEGTWPIGVCRECLSAEKIERLEDALRDILDIAVGWSRNFTHAEMLIQIEKIGREALSS